MGFGTLIGRGPGWEPIVESKRFDSLIRNLVTDASRRGIVRGLAAAIVGGSDLILLGID